MTDSKKIIIGLTGNIATGKSVIRQMLVNLGGMGIDADVVAHRMLYPDGPAYQPVIDAFGKKILNTDQTISRPKLGQIVFSDSDALKILENLVHPAVNHAIEDLINRACQKMVIIEAIKLLESGLAKTCDQIWVSHAAENVQMERLITTRKMTPTEAKRRIHIQPPQQEKRLQADVVINTENTFQQTWQQMIQALDDTIHTDWIYQPSGENTRSARLAQLEDLFNHHNQTHDLYEQMGQQMILVRHNQTDILDATLWKNWNFTGTLDTTIPDQHFFQNPVHILQALINQAQKQQVEIFLAKASAHHRQAFRQAKFTKMNLSEITHPAWRQAAQTLGSENKRGIWAKIISAPFETRMRSK